MTTETPSWTQDVVPLLKGLAIAGVVLTHVLSSLPGVIFTTSSWSWLFIGLDQTLRFCVPLFLGLSGYALARKYHYNAFQLSEFLRRRLWKLLPLYLVWSAILMLVLSTVPQWRTMGDHLPIWWMLIVGGADYHLYFIPMIFQLYALFPLFWIAMRRPEWRWVLVSLAVASQFMLFGIVNYYLNTGTPRLSFLLTDQGQYLLFTSWWGYFLLGMLLAYLPRNLTEWRRRWQALTMGLLGLSWVWVMVDAWVAIQHGLDPLYALRFTRWPVIVYACLFMVVTVSGMERWERWLSHKGMWLKKTLLWLGQYSFLIYLSHTFLLRLIFSTDPRWSRVQLPLLSWIGLVGIWVASWWLSTWLQKRLRLNG